MVFNIFEIYVALLAVVCTAAGIFLAMRLGRHKTDELEGVEDLALTDREFEVLQLLTQGLSNAEIAERLFLSLSTVKTHVSKLFVKMGVKSRTQAVDKANRLGIVPRRALIL